MSATAGRGEGWIFVVGGVIDRGMPAGRPTSKTEAIVNEIMERLAHGEPLARICSDDHMPAFSTVWRWEESDEEFRNLSLRARRYGTHYLADQCLDISDEDVEDGAAVQRNKLRVDTRLRLIGQWNRKEYGSKQEIEHSGGTTNTVNLSNLTPAQLEALSSIGLAGE